MTVSYHGNKAAATTAHAAVTATVTLAVAEYWPVQLVSTQNKHPSVYVPFCAEYTLKSVLDQPATLFNYVGRKVLLITHS